MNELNLEQFSPKRAELVTLAEAYKALSIQGIEDKPGYLAVDEARKDLKRKRVEIVKTGKALREEAVSFQKKVIATEKELVSLIEPIEIELEEKQKVIDDAIQIEKRKASLPYRMEKMKDLGLEIAEEFILLMDDSKFLAYHSEMLAKKLETEALKLAEDRRKLEEGMKKLEEQKAVEAAKEAARLEAQQRQELALKLAAENAEKEKAAAIEAERKRGEDERLAFIQEQKRKEAEALAAIEADKLALELKKKQEAEEQIKLEKKKRYQSFLQKNNYTESNKEEFLIQNSGQTIKLFKLIDSFDL